MKKILLLLFVLVGFLANAQTNLGNIKYIGSKDFNQGTGKGLQVGTSHDTLIAKGVVILDSLRMAGDTGVVGIYPNGVLFRTTGGGGSGYAIDSNAWHKPGDSGTIPGSEFVGTTDNRGLMFKTNNVQTGYLDKIKGNYSFGYQSMLSNTSGGNNNAFGDQALKNNSTGSENIGIGNAALRNNETTDGNIGIGSRTLQQHTTVGDYNIGIGSSALSNDLSGTANIAIGRGGMFSEQSGYSNTGIGDSAYATTLGSGIYNTGIGSSVEVANDATSYSISLGYKAIAESNQFALSPYIYNIKATGLAKGVAGYVLMDTTGNGDLSLQPDTGGSGGSGQFVNLSDDSTAYINANFGGVTVINSIIINSTLLNGDATDTIEDSYIQDSQVDFDGHTNVVLDGGYMVASHLKTQADTIVLYYPQITNNSDVTTNYYLYGGVFNNFQLLNPGTLPGTGNTGKMQFSDVNLNNVVVDANGSDTISFNNVYIAGNNQEQLGTPSSISLSVGGTLVMGNVTIGGNFSLSNVGNNTAISNCNAGSNCTWDFNSSANTVVNLGTFLNGSQLIFSNPYTSTAVTSSYIGIEGKIRVDSDNVVITAAHLDDEAFLYVASNVSFTKIGGNSFMQNHAFTVNNSTVCDNTNYFPTTNISNATICDGTITYTNLISNTQSDTTDFKPVVADPTTGTLYRFDHWPSGSGGSFDTTTCYNSVYTENLHSCSPLNVVSDTVNFTGNINLTHATGVIMANNSIVFNPGLGTTDNTSAGFGSAGSFGGVTGSRLTAFGASALSEAQSNVRCAAFGSHALEQATGDCNNGFGDDAADHLITGQWNNCFGSYSGAMFSYLNYTMAFGHRAKVYVSNTAIWGAANDAPDLAPSAFVLTGMGTVYPKAKLHIVRDTVGQPALIVKGITIDSGRVSMTDSVLMTGLSTSHNADDSMLVKKGSNGVVGYRSIPSSGGGSGTVTSVATGYGLSGGTITTTGTLLVDSASLHNYFLAWRDTINRIATKSNVGDTLLDNGVNKLVNGIDINVSQTGHGSWKSDADTTTGSTKLATQGYVIRQIGDTTNSGGVNKITATAPITAISSGHGSYNIALTTPLSVANGGTGQTTFTAGSIPFMGASIMQQNNTKLFWDSSNARLGIDTVAPNCRVTINENNLLVTQDVTKGLYLRNSTAATAGATTQISPAIYLEGSAWKSNATAASQLASYRFDVVPLTGAGAITSTLQISSSVNGGAYNARHTFSSGGVFSSSGKITSASSLEESGQGTGSNLFIIGGSIANGQYRTTNAGSSLSPEVSFIQAGLTTAGAPAWFFDAVQNGLVLTAANGTRQISRAGINLASLYNVAGSESGALTFSTQSGGAAMSEKMRIDSVGRVGIGKTPAGSWLHIIGSTTTNASLSVDSGAAPSSLTKGQLYSDGNDLHFITGTPATDSVFFKNKKGQAIDTAKTNAVAKISGDGIYISTTKTGKSSYSVAYTGPTLSSGTYSPTVTDIANIDSHTEYDLQYMQVGDVVTVSGKLTVKAAIPAVSTQLSISLPVTDQNFSTDKQAGGSGCATGISIPVSILSNASAVDVTFEFIAQNATTTDFSFSFTYLILH